MWRRDDLEIRGDLDLELGHLSFVLSSSRDEEEWRRNVEG